MCNIAGYVGNRAAAPILIDMMKREEGWNGGCYTGLATLHDGSIRFEKLTGDVERLIANTAAASLPGNIGFIHSRTPSGGDDEWAHPFVGEQDGKIRTAYIANGSAGCFKDRMPDMCDMAIRLEDAGYAFRSRSKEAVGNYPTLRDGSGVHMSDVMAQLITEKIVSGMKPRKAMEEAFCELPGEIVGLLISLEESDAIAWARINMPMYIAFASHGAYLSSTPQAFPEDAGPATLLPACSSGMVYPDGYTVTPFVNPPARVAGITPGVMAQAYAEVERVMQDGFLRFNEITPFVHPLFEEADCDQASALVYRILCAFEKAGRLEIEKTVAPGVSEGITAPVFRGKLVK